jgi:hypothetical protein
MRAVLLRTTKATPIQEFLGTRHPSPRGPTLDRGPLSQVALCSAAIGNRKIP